MSDVSGCALQLTDGVTGRRFALRIDPDHAGWTLRRLLERYLRDCPLEELLAARRITPRSAEDLRAIQDYVYAVSDEGALLDVYPGVVFRQGGATVGLDESPVATTVSVRDTDVSLMDVVVDRLGAGYDRNWAGFHRRRWDADAEKYAAFVRESLERYLGNAADEAAVMEKPADAKRVVRESLERELGDAADEAAVMETPADAKRVLRALARRVWDSHFENYSRFRGRMLSYKTGDETVRNISEGAGGICSEKVQALRFLTDRLGLPSRYVLAGADALPPVPEDRLREMLTTFDFRFSKRYMRYWQHVALVYNIGGEEVLVDATNGNVPFLFLEGEAAQRLLRDEDKAGVPVRMAVREERFYYHHVDQSIVEDLYFAMEGWIEDVDLMQVFDNELGLYISRGYFVTPLAYRSDAAFARLSGEYETACTAAGLRCEVAREWTLDTPLGSRFASEEPDAAAAVMASRDGLLGRFDEYHGAGHDSGLVIVELDVDA